MIIGGKRVEEARVCDSEAGYHQFQDEQGNAYGSFEVFWYDGHGLFGGNDDYDEGYEPKAGWYWWPCLPGCLPDGEHSGPFATSIDARRDADEHW